MVPNSSKSGGVLPVKDTDVISIENIRKASNPAHFYSVIPSDNNTWFQRNLLFLDGEKQIIKKKTHDNNLLSIDVNGTLGT